MNTLIYTEQAGLLELQKVLKIERSCFGEDAFSKSQMAYLMIRAKGLFLVAKHANETVGYISFLTSKRHNNGRIYSIAVSADYRGKGVATLLIDEVMERAKATGMRKIFLEVRKDNISAISLYEKKGFVKCAEKPNYYHDGSGAYSLVCCF